MPLVDIQLIRGVFTPDQKQLMIQKVTDAMVAVEGETMRPVTWVRVQEIESGEWFPDRLWLSGGWRAVRPDSTMICTRC